MSLIAPTLIAILVYGESASPLKIGGILLAISSIFFISLSKSKATDGIPLSSSIDESRSGNMALWFFPIATLIGSCIIDTGLYWVNEIGIVNSTNIDFIASIFFFAALFGIFLVIRSYISEGITIRTKDVIAGFALGIPNFFSIYLIIQVLSNGMDGSVVFPINNVGILTLTAILGVLFFGERFNVQKSIGLLLALTAIALIALG